MKWHLIEGEAGCAYAVEHDCVAVVVDALRASATAAALLHAGAQQVLVCREVYDARRAKSAWPHALLYGERGGMPPTGFDHGNSPADAVHARGRDVIFTTTTGANRLVACWGAHAVYMGSTVNAAAVLEAAVSHERDIVLIPAGLTGHAEFEAQEDRVAAVYLAMRSQGDVGEGAQMFERYASRIAAEGLEALFASSVHAEKLRGIGQETDVALCAQEDTTPSAPRALEKNEYGVLVANVDGAASG